MTSLLADLLPCPFCGSIADLNQDDDEASATHLQWGVTCSELACNANHGWYAHARKAGAIEAWNTRVASAQVREVEALPLCTDPACFHCDPKPAAEPVANCTAADDTPSKSRANRIRLEKGEPAPVAQDFDKFNLWTHHELVTHVRQQQATIADHARIVASLEADNERLRGAFDDHDETASMHWYGEWVDQKRRAEQAEASLAACRADAERYRWLRELQATIIYKRNSEGGWSPLVDTCGTSTRCDSLDTAIDAARSQP